jgi:hypothetical protein
VGSVVSLLSGALAALLEVQPPQGPYVPGCDVLSQLDNPGRAKLQRKSIVPRLESGQQTQPPAFTCPF